MLRRVTSRNVALCCVTASFGCVIAVYGITHNSFHIAYKNENKNIILNILFFYSAPVMEFNLANGQTGSVGQTPRKK